LGYPKQSLLIVGHNSLQIFGPSLVKCYTFHIAKQQLIILSRMVQSKDSIALSKMRFPSLFADERRYTISLLIGI
jgi:hypothetical protein